MSKPKSGPRTATSAVALDGAKLSVEPRVIEVNDPRDYLPSIEPLVIDIKDVRRYLPIGRSTVYRLIATGELETVSVGRRNLLTVRGIRALVERGARRALGSAA